MTVIYNPDQPHRCVLSGHRDGVSTHLQPGAVEVCDECGKAYVYHPIPWEQIYRPLRPWPFDRKQRQALRVARISAVRHD